MSGIKILFYTFCALWLASFVAWIICISVPNLKESNAHLWCLIPIEILCLCINITGIFVN